MDNTNINTRKRKRTENNSYAYNNDISNSSLKSVQNKYNRTDMVELGTQQENKPNTFVNDIPDQTLRSHDKYDKEGSDGLKTQKEK